MQENRGGARDLRPRCYHANGCRTTGVSQPQGCLHCCWSPRYPPPIRIAIFQADGPWTRRSSHFQGLDTPVEPAFTIVQQDAAIHSSTNASYALDGSETRYRVGDTSCSSAVKWEGAALLINTLVSGPRNYTVMDRWRLSRGPSDTDDHAAGDPGHAAERGRAGVSRQKAGRRRRPRHTFPRRVRKSRGPCWFVPRSGTTPAAQSDVTVPAGTHIALALRNAVDTKHSKEGDRIYLETIYPVAAGGRIVIPRGSFVNGTITISKPAGRVKGKGELFIRFDSLTLPNGATRDFRSRLNSADGAKVDREEGKVTGERDTGRDVGTVAVTTGMGASLGGLIGAASGSPLKGVGIGGAVGAAAGLGSILLKKGPDATLRQGTTMDMILDRDITFHAGGIAVVGQARHGRCLPHRFVSVPILVCCFLFAISSCMRFDISAGATSSM